MNIINRIIHILAVFILIGVFCIYEQPQTIEAAGSTFYLDYENGNDANDGSDWANAWKTITSGATAERIAPGDTIRIAKSPDPSSIGNATWTDLSKTVTLASAQTLNVDLCESTWTQSTYVTSTADSTYPKEGTYASKHVLASSFTTGKIAYYQISDTDFSSYQKLSFWFKNTSAVTANYLKVCLCSDTAGDTIVDTFFIPAIPSTNRYLPLTLTKDGGGNLGSSIQSIAIYAETDPGTPTIYLDDIITCTTDGLNLQSLISKNSLAQGGTEGWYGLQSINGTTLLLDNDTNTLASAGRGYSGDTETVATYKRETIKTSLASSSSTQVQAIQDSGTVGSLISYEGGYNTSTSLQDGETFFDGLNGYGYGIYSSGKQYIKIENISGCRYYRVFSIGPVTLPSRIEAVGWDISVFNMSNCLDYGGSFSCANSLFRLIGNANNNGSSNGNVGVTISGYSSIVERIYNANNNLCGGSQPFYGGVNISGAKVYRIDNANNNDTFGVSIPKWCGYISTRDNGISSIYGGSGYVAEGHFDDPIVFSSYYSYYDYHFTVGNINGTSSSGIFSDGASDSTYGLINSQTTTRHTASGIAWRFSPASTRTSDYPASLSIAKIACTGNKEVTVNAWVKQDSTSDISGQIKCEGLQISGVDDDVTDQISNTTTDWEQVSISFTPTEQGVVEIVCEAWYVAGESHFYVDDVTWSEAD